MIKAVFLANDELIPFEKWTLNLSYTLAWLPVHWRERTEQALMVKEMSEGDIDRRRELIGDLLTECATRLIGESAKGLAPIEARKLEILRVLRERGSMPASAFDRRFGLRKCIQSPFFSLVGRENREGQEWLVFDEARLREYAVHSFDEFLEWDRLLLEKLWGD